MNSGFFILKGKNKMINNVELENRITKFMTELGIPMTAFCRNIGMSTSTIRKWKKGQVQLSDAKLQRIDEYLRKYGF